MAWREGCALASSTGENAVPALSSVNSAKAHEVRGEQGILPSGCPQAIPSSVFVWHGAAHPIGPVPSQGQGSSNCDEAPSTLVTGVRA
ncbi:hypothetical protein AOLI_G00308690 [Acnodon oligacanthus]